MHIRLANSRDSAAVLSIYAAYIGTGITFESPLPTKEAFMERMESIFAFYPYLVWEEEGRILGYAYAHRYRERAAYDWDVELSIYLDKSAVSRGIGRKLYGALLDLLTLQGVINAYGLVSTPNPASEALHERMGFTRLGTQRNVGYKLGQWLNVTSYEKQLGPYGENPAPVRALKDVDGERVKAILERYE